jgi:Glycosyltransferase family 87
MRRNVLYGLALFAFCAITVFIYIRQILPIIFTYPWQDFAQDYLGGRALLNRTDELYPVLGPAVARLGLSWDVSIHSTHPPTAFLLVLPFALLNYRLALILWMIVMFVCIILSARGLGLPWRKSLLAGVLSLAWPPTIWSLYQLTPIWLLGLVLAYRFQRRSLASGIWIAVASLPKFLAAPALLYQFKNRKWKAFLGFGSVWLGALVLLLILRPDSIAAYITSNINNSIAVIDLPINGALVIVAWRLGKWVGLAAIVALFLWVLWSGFRANTHAGWACFVWVGIALLPIAWEYSLLPLLPWLVLELRAPRRITRILAGIALLVPYIGAKLTQNPWSVALCIALSGVTFAITSMGDQQEMNNNLETRSQIANKR